MDSNTRRDKRVPLLTDGMVALGVAVVANVALYAILGFVLWVILARSDIAATFRSRLDQIAAAEPVLSWESVWSPTICGWPKALAGGKSNQGCAYCPPPAESQLSTLTR